MSNTMNQPDMLSNLLNSIHSELRDANMMGNYGDQVVGFFKAVDWNEKWILGILGFHICCLLTTIGLRNKHDMLSIYFFILLGLALLTQPLNSLGMTHWKSFATQPYFDPSGIFVVIIYSLPLVLNGVLALIFILKATFSIMIDTKKLQLKHANKKKEKLK